MDSPLLPTFKKRADISGSPTGMMSNMSLVPMSPGDGDETFAFPDRPAARPTSSTNSRSTSQYDNGAIGQSLSSSTSTRFMESSQNAGQGKMKAAPRFSLFAPNQHHDLSHQNDEQEEQRDGEEQNEEGEGDETVHYPTRVSNAEREDKLRESLYELRQMNEVFDGFLGALESARGHNERLSARVKETSSLLDMYTAILGQQEHNQRLILDKRWTGALDDAAAIVQEAADKLAAEQAAWEAAEAARIAAEKKAEEEERARALREAAVKPKRGIPVRGGMRGRVLTRGVKRYECLASQDKIRQV